MPVSSARYHINDSLCFAANVGFPFKVVVCTFGGALNVWFGIEVGVQILCWHNFKHN